MKLPLFHALEVAVHSRIPQKTRYAEIVVRDYHEPAKFHTDTLIEASARLAARTRVTDEQLANDHTGTLLRAKRMAAERLARELYGPVERELAGVLHMLWDEGFPADHEACQKLHELIRALRGEDVR